MSKQTEMAGITPDQLQLMLKLWPKIGQKRYRRLKKKHSIPAETKIPDLTAYEAYWLIDEMLQVVKR